MQFSSLVLMMLLVRGECDPSCSRGVWRRHVSWAVLLGPANASPVLSVSSKRAPRFEISRHIASYKSFFEVNQATEHTQGRVERAEAPFPSSRVKSFQRPLLREIQRGARRPYSRGNLSLNRTLMPRAVQTSFPLLSLGSDWSATANTISS